MRLQKSKFSNSFRELGKIWRGSLGYSKIPVREKLKSIRSPRTAFQNPRFESVNVLGKVASEFKFHCCEFTKMVN